MLRVPLAYLALRSALPHNRSLTTPRAVCLASRLGILWHEPRALMARRACGEKFKIKSSQDIHALGTPALNVGSAEVMGSQRGRCGSLSISRSTSADAATTLSSGSSAPKT